MAIPDNITTNNILSALEELKVSGYDKSHKSDGYDVVFGQETFPPKMAISIANKYANGEVWPTSEFHGGIETHRYIINRGFPIVHRPNKNPDNGFTSEDLLLFDQFAGKPYDSDNPVHRNAGAFIAQHIWEKTKEWARRLKETKGYKVSGKVVWNQQRNNEFGQSFRDYSWLRIHPDTDYNEQVFFTIGVANKHPDKFNTSRLVIKLDCNTQDLPEEISNAFYQFLRKRGLDWSLMAIPFEQLIMNWHKLIAWSSVYIETHRSTYNEAINLVNSMLRSKGARIVWNGHDWLSPSGPTGKASYEAEASYESQHGYAPEEWLFDLAKLIDGYHYARLEPIYTGKYKHAGKNYDITLFTRNYDDRRWYWVGRIYKVECLSVETSRQISAIYREKGWMSEQIEQLREYSLEMADAYERFNDENRFNIRFKPEHLEMYALQPFSEDDIVPSFHHNLPYLRRIPSFLSKPTIASDDPIQLGSAESVDGTKTIVKSYSPRTIEIVNTHSKIQSALAKHLRLTHPASKIYTESIKTVNNTRIDIHEQLPGGDSIFYEIKTYPDVNYSIRLAIGQLLEYAFFPRETLTRRFVIVSHLAATPSHLDYLRHLSDMLNLNIEFLHFNV